MENVPTLLLENGLDLREVTTKGSILHINATDDGPELESESESNKYKPVDLIGEPVKNFAEFQKTLTIINENGYVKKKILEEGGGLSLREDQTVTIMYAGYWENENEPFDSTSLNKPMLVDLQDNGLLPGLQTAIMSMLVGEMSVFLLSYHIMYGEMGVPPRIKPKSDCVFYIQLLKSILTPQQGVLNMSEPNMFDRVHKEVNMLYSSGYTLFKISNVNGAINLFNKAVNMLHKCRLADEKEEETQEKLLKKLYLNLAICYNKIRKPLRACIACNELRRLNNLWDNGKALLQNAKALRMIGEFQGAEKKLNKALKLCPERQEIKEEAALLKRIKEEYDQSKVLAKKLAVATSCGLSDEFKQEVDNLISNFKENDDLCKLSLPGNFTTAELDYVKAVCVRENLFCNKVHGNFALDKDEDESLAEEQDISEANVDKGLESDCNKKEHPD